MNRSDGTAPTGATTLLSPDNCGLILIDHQPQMAFAVHSIDRQVLINNVVGLAKAARIFNVPTILTTVAADSFSGHLFPEIREVFPDVAPIDRTTMNSWEDEAFVAAVRATGRRKLVMAALWTEVCLAFPALSALGEGYEVYAVEDASGGTSIGAHQTAMQRVVQAGAVPITWLSFLLELQRDWARVETYDAVTEVAKRHAGAYGVGIHYAKSMLGDGATEGGAARTVEVGGLAPAGIPV